MVLEANTIVYPWAMMVHSYDTLFASGTVVASWWFN